MFRDKPLLFDTAGRFRSRRRWWRRDTRRLAGGLVVGLLCAGALATEVYGSGHPNVETVRVKPGQTVWSIAQATYDSSDVRDRVDQIIADNDLRGRTLVAGQELTIPAP